MFRWGQSGDTNWMSLGWQESLMEKVVSAPPMQMAIRIKDIIVAGWKSVILTLL